MPIESLIPLKENILPQPTRLPMGGTSPVSASQILNPVYPSYLPPQATHPENIEGMVTAEQLYGARRYPVYDPTKTENEFAYAQPWYTRLGNGIVKMAATGVGTFAQSFNTIPSTVDAISKRDLSALSNPNGWEADIDMWLKNLEDKFPNYYTNYEQSHPFKGLIPFMSGSANFWGDKVIKNLGFTIGAIGGALAQDAIIGAVTGGIGNVPLISAQLGKASLWINKLFAGTDDVARVLSQARLAGAAEKELIGIKKLGELAAGIKLQNRARYALNLYGATRTEAGVESRDGYRQVKEELINQYKFDHLGQEPTGADLQEIEDYSINALNIRLGINMVLLGASNALQFDNFLRVFNAGASKGIASGLTKTIEDVGKIGLKEGSLDVFEKKALTSVAGRMWEAVKPRLPLIFAEGVYEEGGQFAAERGTYDYYTRKYKNLNNPDNKQNWDSLNEVTHSTLYGLKEQFGTQPGWENMLLGAITAMITGGATGAIDRARGQGKDARLQTSINNLNRYGVTGILSQKYGDTLNTIGIAKEMQDAVNSGDVFKFQNLKQDMFFNYVMSRIPNGMHDVTIEQLKMLKGLDKEEFEKTFGMTFDKTNQLSVDSYVDSLITKANSIKETVDALNNVFINPFKFTINPEPGSQEDVDTNNFMVFEDWKKDLAYYSTTASSVDGRIGSINQSLFKIHPLLNSEVVSKLMDNGSLKDLATLYEEKANLLSTTITELTNSVDKKNIKSQIKTLRTFSERIHLALQNGTIDEKTYNTLLNFELNNQDLLKENIIPIEKTNELLTYGADVNRLKSLKKKANFIYETLSSKDGFEKYFEQAENLSNEEFPETPIEEVSEPITHAYKNNNGEIEEVKLNREYESSVIKIAKMRKAGEQYKVAFPDGSNPFYGTKEQAIEKRDDYNTNLADLAKIKILALNPDGTLKVEDLSGNIQNIPASMLEGYGRIPTEEERLSKDKESIDKEQEHLTNESGNINTGNPNNESIEPEGKLKDVNIYFRSSITESETWNDTKDSAPHIIHSREFLNNFKNFEGKKGYVKKEDVHVMLVTINNEEVLGLKGLASLSLKGDVTKAKDVDNGGIAQVFVAKYKNKLYYINKYGKRLTEVSPNIQADFNEVIFQTMASTKTTYDFIDNEEKPKSIPRNRSDQKEEFLATIPTWRNIRKEILNNTEISPLYKFDISRGIAIEGKENNHVGGTLVPEDKIATQQSLIQISTTGKVAHQGQNITIPKGRPVLQYHDTLQFLNNIRFSKETASAIYEVIRSFVKETQRQSDNNEKIVFNPGFINYLRNVLYYVKKDSKSENQFMIDTATMNIIIGNKNYPISEIDGRKDEIIEQLKNTYHNINNFTLTKKFGEAFHEYYLKDEELLSREWRNYQLYLLSSTHPDGSNRSIENTPLVTNVVAPTPLVPYSFKAKYSTLQDFDVPVQEVEKKQEIPEETHTKETPKFSDFKFDGNTMNTATFMPKYGPVEFISEILENDNIAVGVVDGPAILKLAADKEFMDRVVIPNLTALGKYSTDEKVTQAELAKRFTQIVIEGNLVNLRMTEEPQAPVQETKPSEKADFKNVDAPEDNYRRIGQNETNKERITEIDIEIFKAWAEENVPGIPFEVLENIINTHDGEKAWGVFEQGIAKFYKGAIKGTEYHEVFHGIWKLFLSPEERQSILDEERNRIDSFKDRQTQKFILYSEATDQQLKEKIADDFGDFRLGKLPARTLGEKILKFFRNIIEFVKSFISKPSLKTDLFNAINEGKFKEYKISGTVNQSPEYSRIPRVSATQAFEIVQDMTIRASQFIFANKKHLFDIQKVTGQEIYEYIKSEFTKQNKYQELGEESFELIFKRTKEHLRTLGVKFNTEDLVSVNDQDSNYRSYAADPFTIDVKKTSPYAIKFVTSTLPVTKASNQKGATLLNLPERVVSKSKGYLLNNFSRVFSTLLDKLSNTNSVAKVEEKLMDIAKYDSNFVRLFKNVGEGLDRFSFEKFKYEDWRLFINFYQTFTKQHPDAVIQYINEEEQVYTAPAETYGVARELQREWFQNMKTLSSDPSSIIIKNKSTRTYQVKPLQAKVEQMENGKWKVVNYNNEQRNYATEKEAKLAATKLSFPIKSAKDMLIFLSNLGINIPIEVYLKLKSEQRNEFAGEVSKIYTYIQQTPDIGKLSGKTLGISQPLATLSNMIVKVTNPNQDNVHTNIEGTTSHNYDNDNYPSAFENDFNENDNLTDLLEARPELKDAFSKHSVTLSKGGLFFNEKGEQIKTIKLSYIEGTKNIEKNKGTITTSLSEGDRFTQEINQNLNGKYYILIPADSSREWMINLDNYISFKEVNTGRAWNKIYKTFRGYLLDDVAASLDADNRKQLKNIGNKARDLRFFKDILSERDATGKLMPTSILGAINKMIVEGNTQEEIEQYIDTHISEINTFVNKYITEQVDSLKNRLISFRQLQENKDSSYRYKLLDNKFLTDKDHEGLDKYNLTEKDINNILTFVTANYNINNIELHKILFGDPYQFAVKNNRLEETKRIKSFISPRRKIFDFPAFNTFLNEEMNKAGEILLTPNDYGYHEHKDYLNTITLADVKLVTDLYPEFKESDGASLVMDVAYREIKLKNGQWGTQAELWHQWQMAYTRQHVPGYTYNNNELKQQDAALLNTPEPEFKIDIIKPIVSGTTQGKNRINLVIDKYSQMPLYYKHVEGKALAIQYIKMFKQKVDYGVFESGRKVGVETTYPVYNSDHEFNTAPFDNFIRIPFKIYGIQVETAHEDELEQTRGSQITKNSTLDMFDNGVPITEEAQKNYNRYIESLNMLHENAFNNLLLDFGIEDDGNGYVLTDTRAISETLEYEMLRRRLSENAKDTIQLNDEGQFSLPFEASPVYKQIKDIVYSKIHKSLISPKMSGGPKTMAPVTMWENAKEGRGLVIKVEGVKGWKKITREEYNTLSEDKKKNVRMTSDTLSFYINEDGKRVCQVMLAPWFKGIFDKYRFPTNKSILDYLNKTKEGQEILRGVGFRIPNQSMASIEIFEVKEFLDRSMGDTIIVPSEIVAKTNADFDIDKLNTYLKSVYKDENGNVRLIRWRGSEEATKDFFRDVYTQSIGNKINKIRDGREFRNKLYSIFNKLETLPDNRFSNVEEVVGLSPDELTFYKEHIDTIEAIIDQADEKELLPSVYMENQISVLKEKEGQQLIKLFNDRLKEDYVKLMYTKSLENEHYDALEKMISIPENFDQLVFPVGDNGLSKEAEHLDKLRGTNEEDVKNRILNREFMTTMRHYFALSKKWVGIAAVNITGHSVSQKIQLIIDPKKINRLSFSDKKILGDGTIALPHNTIDGQEYVSMSRIKTADGKEFISNRLSGYATAIVDAANDPFIIKIIGSELLVGTFLFLERIGVGRNTIYFLNQPIIQEYIKYLDSLNYRYLYKDSNLSYIRDKFFASEALLKSAEIDVSSLEDNISNYYQKGKLTEEDNAVQQVILKEFLKYAKMAEYNFKFTQGYNYDTTKFKDAESLSRKKTKTELARVRNIFSSIDDLLDKTFIGKQKDFLDKTISAMGAIFKLEKDEYRMIISDVMRPYEEKEFMSGNDFEMISAKVKAAFLDYIIQTKSGINNMIGELTLGAKSVANQLREAKIKYPDLKILNDLVVVGNDRMDSPETVKLNFRIEDPYDENVYTDMMRELKEVDPVLYNNLIHLIILQGTYKTPVSIKNIIPLEDYKEIVKPIIDRLSPSTEIQQFIDGKFQRNFWRDDIIVPKYNVKFSPNVQGVSLDEHLPFAQDIYGNDIYQYVAIGFPKNSFGKATDRRTLLINPSKDGYNAQNEFLKVGRVVTLPTGMKVDFLTGRNITGNEFAKKNKEGDNSLRDVFGYQKVRLPNGDPLLTTSGEYVYKLVNLWGDGYYVAEYYEDSRPSVLDNGTFKIDKDIPNSDIIEYYTPKVAEKIVEDPLKEKNEFLEDVEKEILSQPIVNKENVVSSQTEIKENTMSGFQGYKGGFENVGKGTSQGDGKDKAMRQVADGFIGEVSRSPYIKTTSGFSLNRSHSSTVNSAIEINNKSKNNIGYTSGQPSLISVTNREKFDEGIYPKVIMLARNGSLKGVELNWQTKGQIKDMSKQGAEFVVGDMPNVDSQFIDYLQEIDAKFTIYHTGIESRIKINNPQFNIARGQTDPNIRSKYFNEGDVSTDREILNKIGKSTHPLNKLAISLMKYSTGKQIKLISKDNTGLSKDGILSSAVNYAQWIEIAEFARFRGLGSEPTLIHEIIHGITAEYINNIGKDSIEYKEFERLFDEAKSKLGESWYALTNMDEFIAGLFTDAAFINALQKVDSTQPTLFKNLLQEIFDYILSLFNINNSNSIYKDAFAVATNILEESQAARELIDSSILSQTNEITNWQENIANQNTPEGLPSITRTNKTCNG